MDLPREALAGYGRYYAPKIGRENMRQFREPQNSESSSSIEGCEKSCESFGTFVGI